MPPIGKLGIMLTSHWQNVSFEIISAKKSYYDDNGNSLQPVWAFNALIRLGSNATNQLTPVKYLCIILMLKNSPESLDFYKIDTGAKVLMRQTTPQAETSGVKKDND